MASLYWVFKVILRPWQPKNDASSPVLPTCDLTIKMWNKRNMPRKLFLYKSDKKVVLSIIFEAYQIFYRSMKLPLHFYHFDSSFLDDLCSISYYQVFGFVVHSMLCKPVCKFFHPLLLYPSRNAHFLCIPSRILAQKVNINTSERDDIWKWFNDKCCFGIIRKLKITAILTIFPRVI